MKPPQSMYPVDANTDPRTRASAPICLVPGDRLVAVVQRERDGCDDAHQPAVHLDQHPVRQRPRGERGDVVGCAAFEVPGPRCHRGEHPRADAVSLDRRPVVPQPLERVARLVGHAEEGSEELERLEPLCEVEVVVGQGQARRARNRRALLLGVGEQQRPRETVRCVRPGDGVVERLVCRSEVSGRRRCVGERAGLTQLDEDVRPQLGGRRLLERPRERRDRVVGRTLRKGRVRGVAKELDDGRIPARRRLEQLCRDLLRRGAERGEEPARLLVPELAFGGSEIVVDGCAHEWVDESERRFGAHDLRPDERSPGLRRIALRQAGE